MSEEPTKCANCGIETEDLEEIEGEWYCFDCADKHHAAHDEALVNDEEDTEDE